VDWLLYLIPICTGTRGVIGIRSMWHIPDARHTRRAFLVGEPDTAGLMERSSAGDAVWLELGEVAIAECDRCGGKGEARAKRALKCSRYRLQSRSRKYRFALSERIRCSMVWKRERWHPGCHSRKRQCLACRVTLAVCVSKILVVAGDRQDGVGRAARAGNRSSGRALRPQSCAVMAVARDRDEGRRGEAV